MIISFEELLLKQLIVNDIYSRQIIPFLETSLFEQQGSKEIFDMVKGFIIKYNSLPTYEALIIDLSNKKLSENIYNNILKKLEAVNNNADKVDNAWLFSQTEEWAKQQKLMNAMKEGISLLDKPKDKGKIYDLIKDAISFSFKSSIGHDYLEDFEHRYDYYHRKEIKVGFDIDWLNDATEGGVSRGTLNVFIAGINVGKTLLMCHMAANNLVDRKECSVSYFRSI